MIMEKADILTILRSKASVFTFKDIVLATSEAKPLLLKRRLSYYLKKGELYHIRRGLYAKDKNYDRLELATKIFTPSYVSFETILRQEGIIFQYYSTIFVASYQTKEIVCDGQVYSFKKIKDTILMNNAGIENRGAYSVASKERAFLDMLYLNKNYYFDNLAPLNFDKVFALLPIYNNQRMAKKIDLYFKEFNASRKLL
jgi:predicted transcriptional regulator of viral defense system